MYEYDYVLIIHC